MRPGTTPTHTFTVPLDLTNCLAIQVVYKQGDKIRIRKQLKDMRVTPGTNSSTVVLTLTQSDTLALRDERWQRVLVQMRVVMSDGTAMASNILDLAVFDCLDDMVLPV